MWVKVRMLACVCLLRSKSDRIHWDLSQVNKHEMAIGGRNPLSPIIELLSQQADGRTVLVLGNPWDRDEF